MKLNVNAFGLACGILWGIGLFFITWWIIAFEGVTYDRTIIGLVYRGYSISPWGSVIGLIWAFIDGWVGGIILAWLYNILRGSKPAETTAIPSGGGM